MTSDLWLVQAGDKEYVVPEWFAKSMESKGYKIREMPEVTEVQD